MIKQIEPAIVQEAFFKTNTRPCRACTAPGNDRKCCALGAMYLLETSVEEEETAVVISHFEFRYGKHYLRGFTDGWDSIAPDWETIPESAQIRNYRAGHNHGNRCWQEAKNYVQAALSRA